MLCHRLRDYILNKDGRNLYVEHAVNYLKNKSHDICEMYDVIIIGAGIHAATYIYTIKKHNPTVRMLVLEKTSCICSTFAKLGDSLVLNSPTYTKVGLNSNIVPGHFIQLSDFDELFENSFPTAKHLYELAVMILFHSDANIVFNAEVNDITHRNNYYSVHSLAGEFLTKRVIIANGLGSPKKTTYINEKICKKFSSGDDFIIACHKDSNFLKTLKNKDIAIIGAGDTANCVMEYIMPTAYPNEPYGFYQETPSLPARVFWIGEKITDIKQFFLRISVDIVTLVG